MEAAQKVQFGSYVLHDRIGAGGMAEIFLATAPNVEGYERELVIKRILPSLSTDEQFVKMFVEEARLCVHLKHPNIVQVYDLGDFDQQYFIAMEYVHGRDLLKTLAACAKKRIAFPTDLALFIVMEVLKALDYAHNLRGADGAPLGIIHRDVSPSNVLLSFDGKVKLGDFGIAKATIRERTATGILKGKFGYMAPEQVMGRPIDHRADVFAVGILLYELLTGHRLFAGRSDLAVLERVRDAVIDPPPRHYRPDLSSELEAIVMRALSREATDRFQSTSELHDALYDYTFRKGVVVSPRMLSRFLHDLFLAEETEEQYYAPPLKGAKNGQPSLLGKAVVSSPDRDAADPKPRGASARGRHHTTSERPRSTEIPAVEASIELSDSGLIPTVAPSKSSELQFDDESTEDPDSADFGDDPTSTGGPELDILPFPGMEQRRGSTFDPRNPLRELGAAHEQPIEEPTQQTDIAEIRSRRPLRDPAEDPSVIIEGDDELSQMSTGGDTPLAQKRARFEPIAPSRSPGSEVRALRREKVENFETNLDLSERQASSVPQRPASPKLFKGIEPSMTPYGGVPVIKPQNGVAHSPAPSSDSIEETVDGEAEGHSASLVEAVRRAMDPTEPLEPSNGEAERTDLLDSNIGFAVIPRNNSDDLDEMSQADLIELTGDPTHDPEESPDKTDLQADVDDGELSALETQSSVGKRPSVPAEGWVDQTHQNGDFQGPEPSITSTSTEDFEGPATTEGPGLPEEASQSGEESIEPSEASELLPMSLLDESAMFEASIQAPLSGEDSGTGVRDEDIEMASVATASEDPRTARDAEAIENLDDGIPSSVADEWQNIIKEATSKHSEDTGTNTAPVQEASSSDVLEPMESIELGTETGPTSNDDQLAELRSRDPSNSGATETPQIEPNIARAATESLDSRPPTVKKARPVLMPADPTPAPRAASSVRRAPSKRSFSRPGSEPPRRRVATRAALSVVNPAGPPAADEATRLGELALPEDHVFGRGDGVDRANSRIARLDTSPAPLVREDSSSEETNMGSRSPAPRKRESSGVTSALEEASVADAEIQLIRAESLSRSIPDELTTNGDLAGLIGLEQQQVSVGEPTSPGGRARDDDPLVGRLDSRAQSSAKLRRRFASRGVVLFDDAEETVNAPGVRVEKPAERGPKPLSNIGRLDDSGASDLFGALALIDGGDELEMKGFAPEEEASFETTGGISTSDFAGPVREPDVSRPASEIVAPSVQAELRARSERPKERTSNGIHFEDSSVSELRDPAEEPSGIELRFDAADDPTDSIGEDQIANLPRFGGAAARPRSVVVLEDDGPLAEISEGGTLAPEILAERSDDDRDATDHEDDHDRFESLRFQEETPAADDFVPPSSRFNMEETPRLEDIPSSDRGVYGAYAESSKNGDGRLVSDAFDIDLGVPQRGARVPSPMRSVSPPPRTPPPSEQNGSSLEAERRMRAVVERQRPVKEAKRPVVNGASTPPPAVMQPTATGHALAVPSMAPQPQVVRPAMTPISPQVARGPIPTNRPPVSVEVRSSGLTTRNAMFVLVIVLAIVLGSLITIKVVEWWKRDAVAIAPVAPSKAKPIAPIQPKADVKASEPAAAPAKAKVAKETPPAPAPLPVQKEAVKEPVQAKEPPPPPKEPAPKVVKEPAPKVVKEPAPKVVAKEPPPKPKEAKPKARPVEKPKPKPAAAATAEKGTGILVECREPVEVIISKSGGATDVKKKLFKVAPGSYKVTLKRGDGSSKTAFVKVVAGQSVPVSCD